MYSEAPREAGVNLSAKPCEREAAGHVGLIGAGKFGAMFLAQARSLGACMM